LMDNGARGAVAEALTVTTVGEFCALLTTVMLPLFAPVVCGTKVMVRLTLSPAASVCGTRTPETANSLDEEVMALSFTGIEPGLLRVTDLVAVAPVTTDPKSMADGLTLSTRFD